MFHSSIDSETVKTTDSTAVLSRTEREETEIKVEIEE